MDLLLKDKVVLVTSSQPRHWPRHREGVRCGGLPASCYRRAPRTHCADAENALRADGATVAGEVADVTQPDDAARLVQAAVTAFDGIDILVNNVGGGGGGRAIADSTNEDWRTTLEINLLQTVRMMRLALPHMSGRAGVAVMNVSWIFRLVAGRSSAPVRTARPRQRSSSTPNAGLWNSCRTAYG